MPSTPTYAGEPLLAAHQLSKQFSFGKIGFFGEPEGYLQAVSSVSVEVQPGETLGLVGESGCGKSTLARLLMLLYTPDQGRVLLHGREMTRPTRAELTDFRRRVQMVFQDPFSSLNPRLPVSAILEEPLRIHGVRDRAARCRALLDEVGLGADTLNRYPHEFSGGQRQRIAIARALALRPQLIVADEAVSALDVSVQSQILNLLAELKSRFGLAYLFISHDLAVVDHIADRVAVMYLGRIVEEAPRAVLFGAPAHPYTRALIDSIPSVRAGGKRRSGVVIGDVPSALDPPSGCAYHPRCGRARPLCAEQAPVFGPARAAAPAALARAAATPLQQHRVACHFPLEVTA